MGSNKLSDVGINDLVNPQTLTSKAGILEEQIHSILDDFQKYYVFYNKNPEYNEYQQIFENIKNNMNHLNSELMLTSNSVDTNTDKISQKMLDIDILIKKVKKENDELTKRLGKIKQQMNSSGVLIDNYKTMYDINYLKNWALLCSIIISCATFSFVFRPIPSK